MITISLNVVGRITVPVDSCEVNKEHHDSWNQERRYYKRDVFRFYSCIFYWKSSEIIIRALLFLWLTPKFFSLIFCLNFSFSRNYHRFHQYDWLRCFFERTIILASVWMNPRGHSLAKIIDSLHSSTIQTWNRLQIQVIGWSSSQEHLSINLDNRHELFSLTDVDRLVNFCHPKRA